MEDLCFKGAFVAAEDLLLDFCPYLMPREYEYWSLDAYHKLSICDGIDFKMPSFDIDYEIVPMLQLKNFSETNFKVEECFTVKGLNFKIISNSEAICLSSIGSYSYENKDCFSIDYHGSELEAIVNDWYDYFISKETVTKYDVLDVYDIKPMPTTIGRFHIVNRDGKVRHNASGYGFTSPEKARNMLKHYAALKPIPMEDIAAYKKYKKILDEVEELYRRIETCL